MFAFIKSNCTKHIHDHVEVDLEVPRASSSLVWVSEVSDVNSLERHMFDEFDCTLLAVSNRSVFVGSKVVSPSLVSPVILTPAPVTNTEVPAFDNAYWDSIRSAMCVNDKVQEVNDVLPTDEDMDHVASEIQFGSIKKGGTSDRAIVIPANSPCFDSTLSPPGGVEKELHPKGNGIGSNSSDFVFKENSASVCISSRDGG
ncbi:uncharacterized protein [Rutidosis leptorrhynchoides]|uniref:uncharacterized protein n=1 Tax=Rutidosis leptorrhynchoides TaxID=125765 RepID=UPI003A9A4251